VIALPTWRVRTVRALTASAATLVVAIWVGTASLAYTLISDIAGAQPLTHVNTPHKQVALMIDVNPGTSSADVSREVSTLASLTCRQGMKVTFALPTDPHGIHRKFDSCHSDAVPRLGDSGVLGWMGTRGKLTRLAHELGWGKHFPYATSGASFLQWYLAHHAGGQPIAGAVTVSQTDKLPTKLHAGEMIELRPKTLHAAKTEIMELREQLSDDHLQSVSVGTLLKGSGTNV
jgi:hypothetical protein